MTETLSLELRAPVPYPTTHANELSHHKAEAQRI